MGMPTCLCPMRVGKKDMDLTQQKRVFSSSNLYIVNNAGAFSWGRRSPIGKTSKLPRPGWPGHYPWASQRPINSSKRVEPHLRSVQSQRVMINFQWLGQKKGMDYSAKTSKIHTCFAFVCGCTWSLWKLMDIVGSHAFQWTWWQIWSRTSSNW